MLCDRYVFSALALFQYRGLDYEFLVEINQGIVRPNVALYLDVGPAHLFDRLVRRDGGQLKVEERVEHRIEKITSYYRALTPALQLVDGDRAIEDVHADVFEQVRRKRVA